MKRMSIKGLFEARRKSTHEVLRSLSALYSEAESIVDASTKHKGQIYGADYHTETESISLYVSDWKHVPDIIDMLQYEGLDARAADNMEDESGDIIVTDYE